MRPSGRRLTMFPFSPMKVLTLNFWPNSKLVDSFFIMYLESHPIVEGGDCRRARAGRILRVGKSCFRRLLLSLLDLSLPRFLLGTSFTLLLQPPVLATGPPPPREHPLHLGEGGGAQLVPTQGRPSIWSSLRIHAPSPASASLPLISPRNRDRSIEGTFLSFGSYPLESLVTPTKRPVSSSSARINLYHSSLYFPTLYPKIHPMKNPRVNVIKNELRTKLHSIQPPFMDLNTSLME